MEYKTGSFQKYENSPVFGNLETGTMFDAYVWKQNGRLRMDVSWRPKQALAVTFSDDGIHWDEGVYLYETEARIGAFYSNNLVLDREDGSQMVLIQSSIPYHDYYKPGEGGGLVNISHWKLEIE